MKHKLTLRIYRNKRRELAWCLIGGNGEKLAQGEGYKRRGDLESSLVLIFMGRYLANGSKSVDTVLALREDIQLEDDTVACQRPKKK